MLKEARWTPNADYTGMRQMCDSANHWLYRAWTDKKRKFKIEPAYTTYFSDNSLLLKVSDENENSHQPAPYKSQQQGQ